MHIVIASDGNSLKSWKRFWMVSVDADPCNSFDSLILEHGDRLQSFLTPCHPNTVTITNMWWEQSIMGLKGPPGWSYVSEFNKSVIALFRAPSQDRQKEAVEDHWKWSRHKIRPKWRQIMESMWSWKQRRGRRAWGKIALPCRVHICLGLISYLCCSMSSHPIEHLKCIY